MTLEQKQRKQLAGQAHQIRPFLVIADGALRETHLLAIQSQFQNHELIKIRMPGVDKKIIADVIKQICDTIDCELITRTGHIAVFYRVSN